MFTTSKVLDSPSNTPPDARRELLSRVLASAVFQKSKRLSDLLTFVCELTLQGRERELNEQRIGEAVFGRSRDYDSSIDGIVRTQASRLRSRLDSYFEGEGAKEPVRVVIPRGRYVPRFESRAMLQFEHRLTVNDDPGGSVSVPLPEDSAEQSEESAPGLRSSSSLRWYANALVPWTLVAVLAVLMLGGLAFELRRLDGGKNASRGASYPFWSNLFAENQRTLVVSGDSGLVMWQNLTRRDVHLAEYLSRDYLKQAPPTAPVSQALLVDLGSRRYTSIVDLDMAEYLLRIAEAHKGSSELRYARDLRPNDLKQGNVILVGAAEATPWVELFEPNMNFHFHNDREKHVFSVLNRTPNGHEPRQWDSAYDDAEHHVYAVVAYLPNLTGHGNALLLEGTSMAGTESAWDFVSDDAQLLPFLQRIRKPDGSIPHFEAVLGTNNVNGSAGKNVLLAWRTER